jgi:hypothetical protein
MMAQMSRHSSNVASIVVDNDITPEEFLRHYGDKIQSRNAAGWTFVIYARNTELIEDYLRELGVAPCDITIYWPKRLGAHPNKYKSKILEFEKVRDLEACLIKNTAMDILWTREGVLYTLTERIRADRIATYSKK